MRFGIAVVDITPPFPTTLAGYAARQDHFDRINDPVTFTALILQEGKRRAFIGATDLITFEDNQVAELRKRIAAEVRAPLDNVMLNASHTHGGPEVRDTSVYFRKDRDVRSSRRYREWLGPRVISAAKEAVKRMEPATLWHGVGTSSIPMNRRLTRGQTVVNAPNPRGRVDNVLHVLAIRGKDGGLRAVGVRLSCHPVATGAQHLVTADYPGAFRAAFARAFGPDVVPFFLQGAGGDARPSAVQDGDRWRAMPHEALSSIGETLLHETMQVLTGADKLRPIRPVLLRGRFAEAIVPCERRYTRREDFEKLAEEGGMMGVYARAALNMLDEGLEVPDRVSVGVQTIWLANGFALVGVAGEMLQGPGRHLERSLRPATALVLGYTNGCAAYIPDTKELRRGGYETTSYLYHPWTGPFAPGIEKTLAASVWKLR